MSLYEINPTTTAEFLPVPANSSFFVLSAAFSGAGALPTVTYVSPAPSSTIEPDDPIVLDVLDVDTPSPSTFLFVRFVDGRAEVVWDGSAFTPFYATSVRVAVADGFRYTLRRSGEGWIAGLITFNAHALDDTGGIAT